MLTTDLRKAVPILILLSAFTACMESGDPAEEPEVYRPVPAVSSDLPAERLRTFAPGEYVGAITAGMPMSQVENIYGSHNLESRPLPASEGTTIPGYVLFPNTHDELYIELGEDKQPARARFNDPRSNWNQAGTGLMIGTTLSDLIRMNGRPFTFQGFGWDYGGIVGDWHGGRLEDVTVRLTYAPERLPAPLPDSLLGDVSIPSDADGLENLGLRVREISIPIRPVGEPEEE